MVLFDEGPRMARSKVWFAACAMAMVIAGPTVGRAAGLVNGSFEEPGGAPIRQVLGNGDTIVTGWTAHDGTQAFSTYYESNGEDGINAADGNYYVSFGHNGATGASLTQAFDTVFGAQYTLNYQIRLQQGVDLGSNFQISASTGDSVNSGDAVLAAWSAGTPLTFVGTGSAVTLTILDTTVGGGGSNLAIDDLRLSAVGGDVGVPEPATWALMIAGFGGMGAVFRGRRSADARLSI
jgi:Protein of unknown function (DUF642)/PEP-CTERM motif